MEKNSIINNKTYILKEYKDGKTISVRQLQLEVLTIMDELVRVCDKNDIPYLLIAGSSLGMVNYEGFIPWDDDIDVSIPIEYWDKFIEVLQKDLSPDFYFDCYELDKRYNVISGPWMKIRKKNTYVEEVNYLLKNRCKKGDGIFVDVIPIGPVSQNKFIDEVERTIVKINMFFIVLLDNIHINPIIFKNFVYWFSRKSMKWHKNSKLVSQPVSVPWEKFMHEPVFLKEDVFPLKKYNFEGRQYYSYNNIEKVLKKYYSSNCLKKWDGEKWIDPYPESKRQPKHVKNINLDSDYPYKEE